MEVTVGHMTQKEGTYIREAETCILKVFAHCYTYWYHEVEYQVYTSKSREHVQQICSYCSWQDDPWRTLGHDWRESTCIRSLWLVRFFSFELSLWYSVSCQWDATCYGCRGKHLLFWVSLLSLLVNKSWEFEHLFVNTSLRFWSFICLILKVNPTYTVDAIFMSS